MLSPAGGDREETGAGALGRDFNHTRETEWFFSNQTHIGPEVWLSLPLNDPALPTNLSSPVSLSDAKKGLNIKVELPELL